MKLQYFLIVLDKNLSIISHNIYSDVTVVSNTWKNDSLWIKYIGSICSFLGLSNNKYMFFIAVIKLITDIHTQDMPKAKYGFVHEI